MRPFSATLPGTVPLSATLPGTVPLSGRTRFAE
jgi:hypothetical protein